MKLSETERRDGAVGRYNRDAAEGDFRSAHLIVDIDHRSRVRCDVRAAVDVNRPSRAAEHRGPRHRRGPGRIGDSDADQE